jgi:ribosome assembly protein SQT1
MPANLEDSDDDSVYELPLDDAIEIFEQEANGMDVDASDDEDDDSDLEDVPDASIAHFASHSSIKRQPIYCLAAHPRTSAIAASGGQDDMAYIWDTATGQEIVKLTGHTDSVVAVQFSSDGELIATGGMDGKVRLWRRVKPTRVLNEVSEWSQWEFLTNLEGPDEVTVRPGACEDFIVAD